MLEIRLPDGTIEKLDALVVSKSADTTAVLVYLQYPKNFSSKEIRGYVTSMRLYYEGCFSLIYGKEIAAVIIPYREGLDKPEIRALCTKN